MATVNRTAKSKPAVPARATVRALRKPQCFTDHDHGLPIRGTPAPLPCPFCATSHLLGIVQIEDDPTDGPLFLVQCDECMTQAPAGQTQLEAALLWNHRPEIARAIEILDVLLSKSIPEQPEVYDLDSYRRRAASLVIQARGLLRGDTSFPTELSSADLERFASASRNASVQS